MKLGVFSPVLREYSLEKALKFLEKNGVDCLELGVGGYPGTAHANARELMADKAKLGELKKILAGSNVKISAISVHGNSVHPNKAVADSFEADFCAALTLASELEIDRVVTFSGCPGDGTSAQPNWVTCAWPPEYEQILKYQWDDVLVPYWTDAAARAKAKGVNKIALEMHPGFCVYNPSTLLRLRKAVGDVIGGNFDPSHLIWQGIDIVKAIYALSSAIYFFHAKDTGINTAVSAIKGVLDTTPYSDISNRSWIFRTVGYGGQMDFKQIISALKTVGYDDVISIEHEDALMSENEGLLKAVDYLKSIIIYQKPGEVFWA